MLDIIPNSNYAWCSRLITKTNKSGDPRHMVFHSSAIVVVVSYYVMMLSVATLKMLSVATLKVGII